jgi:hypothetical protein
MACYVEDYRCSFPLFCLSISLFLFLVAITFVANCDVVSLARILHVVNSIYEKVKG